MDFGEDGARPPGGMGVPWLRDAYLARLRGSGAGVALPAMREEKDIAAGDAEGNGGGGGDKNILGASPVSRSELQSPSMLSLGSPDFADVTATAADKGAHQRAAAPPTDPFDEAAAGEPSVSRTVDDAFRSLATRHNLGRSPDTLSHAAVRSYAAHDLRSALAYCTALDALDPFCRAAGHVHVATLVGLGWTL